GRLRMRLWENGRHAEDELVQTGNGPCSVGPVQNVGNRGHAPEDHQDGEEEETGPCVNDPAERKLSGPQGGRRLFGEMPVFGRFPDLEKKREQDESGEAAYDIDQTVIPEIRPVKLKSGEDAPGEQEPGPDRDYVLPSGDEPAEPEGKNESSEREDAAHHAADMHGIETGDRDQRARRVADSAEGDRRGVGDEAQDGRGEGLEAEPDHHGAADRDGRAAATRTFENRSERKGDEEGLEAAILGDAADRFLDDFELAGFAGQLIDENSGDENPRDSHGAEDNPGRNGPG